MGVSDDRPQREEAQVEPGAFAGDGASEYRGHLCGNQPVHQVHRQFFTKSFLSDGVEDDDVIQHERVVKF